MIARGICVGLTSILIVLSFAACDRSPTKPAARKPATTRGGGGPPRQFAMTTRPADGAAPHPTYDAVDLMPPPEIVKELVDRMGFDPFPQTAVQLRSVSGRPKLAVVGSASIKGGEYTVDVEEMTQSRTNTRREFVGWINFKNAAELEEWRVCVIAKWDQPATTAPTSAPVRFDTPIPVTIAWVGPKITDKSANRMKSLTTTRPAVTPDRTRPPASSAAPSPSI